MKTAIYPGTFDPVTRGHMDILLRAAKLVDRLVVGVAGNAGKGPMFSPEERAQMVREEVNGFAANVEVVVFHSLLIDFAQEQGAGMIFRGLRAISDFEYEFQMAGMNRNLRPEIETVFLMSSDKHQFVSSRFVKEIARLGGDVSPFVSPNVLQHLQHKLAAGVELNIEPRLAGTDPP
jgi:pantetheine-phosphate adenylyltransferase